MVAEIEAKTGWNCFICNATQMGKIMSKTRKLVKAWRQREEWLQECRGMSRKFVKPGIFWDDDLGQKSQFLHFFNKKLFW